MRAQLLRRALRYAEPCQARLARCLIQQCSATIVRSRLLARAPCPSTSSSTANTDSRPTTMALRTALVSRGPIRFQPHRVRPRRIDEVLNTRTPTVLRPSPWSRTAESASSDDSWVSDLDGEINSGVGAHKTALTRARGSTFVDCIPSSPGTYRKRSLAGAGLARVERIHTSADPPR
jgi:hypothetical protein